MEDSMEDLKKELDTFLDEAQRDPESIVESWSPIDGEPATYGVEVSSGDMFFIQITRA